MAEKRSTKSSQTVNLDDPEFYLSDPEGTSYAVERRTHTPIKFGKLPPGEAGSYKAVDFMAALPNLRMAMDSMGKGLIHIDPYSTDIKPGTVGQSIRHEAIHSALMNLPPDTANQIQSITTSDPAYTPIARALMQSGRAGYMPDEIPAYAGAYNAKQTPGFEEWRQGYVQRLKDQLTKINPNIAKIYGALSQ